MKFILFIKKTTLIIFIITILSSCTKDNNKELTLYDVPENYKTTIDEEAEKAEEQKLLNELLRKEQNGE